MYIKKRTDPRYEISAYRVVVFLLALLLVLSYSGCKTPRKAPERDIPEARPHDYSYYSPNYSWLKRAASSKDLIDLEPCKEIASILGRQMWRCDFSATRPVFLAQVGITGRNCHWIKTPDNGSGFETHNIRCKVNTNINKAIHLGEMGKERIGYETVNYIDTPSGPDSNGVWRHR